MTLLEAMIAAVILAVVSVACLEGTRGAAVLQRRTAQLSAAVVRADAALQRAAAGAMPASRDALVRRPYGAGDGRDALDVVTVTETLADGRTVRLTRLVERAR
jgi:Tfp pilus assembly protein PilV